MRNRHGKTNSSDFILTTDDEKETDQRWLTRIKHRYVQFILLIITAILYLIHTIRAYIPIQWSNSIRKHFNGTNTFVEIFFQMITTRPITRVYTVDFRPTLIIESLLLRIAENWQAFWLIYILSFIPRRTHLGYIYRLPDVFNIRFCLILIGSLSCQWLSQVGQTSEISCLCLIGSVLALIFTCRYVSLKLSKYEEKYRSLGLSFDWYILRYFGLNALFLYTFSMIYSTVCATIESLGLNFTPNPSIFPSLHQYTTMGLLIFLLLILLYSIFDIWIYKKEFRSIWTPYIFFGYIFLCSPWRQNSSTNNFHPVNEILLWSIFVVSVGMFVVRFVRLTRMKSSKKKIRINSHIEQICS